VEDQGERVEPLLPATGSKDAGREERHQSLLSRVTRQLLHFFKAGEEDAPSSSSRAMPASASGGERKEDLDRPSYLELQAKANTEDDDDREELQAMDLPVHTASVMTWPLPFWTVTPTELPGESSGGIEFTLSHFKVLYIQLRELEEKGCSQDLIKKWVRTLDKDSSNTLTQEPLKSSAAFAGIDDEFQVQRLFFAIANPSSEDAVCTSIKFNELSAWITKMVKAKQRSSGDEEGVERRISK